MVNRKASNDILELLINRNPNYISALFIYQHLSRYEKHDIEEAIEYLIKTDKIISETETLKVSGQKINHYRLKNPNDYLVKTSIQLGVVEVPRLLSDSSPKYFPELLNEQIEKLSEHSDSLEKRFTNLVREEQKKYWANVVGIFGVFISVLSLLIVGLPKIDTDPCLSFWETVLHNLAQLLPIAIVLALFVIVLRWAVLRNNL